MAFHDYLRNSLLNHAFGNVGYTAPGTLYLGLSSTPIADDGTGGTEPIANGYARVSLANNKTNWSTATGAANTIQNAVELAFPESSGAWGTLTHFFVSDATTAGNILASGALTEPKTVGSGEIPRFSAGNITIGLDEV